MYTCIENKTYKPNEIIKKNYNERCGGKGKKNLHECLVESYHI